MTERSEVGKLLSSSIHEVLGSEDIIMEVARDLIKDELKGRVRKVLDEDPELKEEFMRGIEMYYKSKIDEAVSALLIAKASAHLGIKMAPKEVKEELQKEFENVIVKVIDRTI